MVSVVDITLMQIASPIALVAVSLSSVSPIFDVVSTGKVLLAVFSCLRRRAIGKTIHMYQKEKPFSRMVYISVCCLYIARVKVLHKPSSYEGCGVC